jgi:hydrogenase maturation protease
MNHNRGSSGIARIAIIGIGNRYRKDDGAGLAAAQELRKLNLPHALVVETTGDGAALMELWKEADAVIVVDAMVSGAAPGAVYRFDANAGSLPACFSGISSHTFGLAEAIELARVLGSLPPKLLVYGIEIQKAGMGTGLTAAVGQAVCQAVELIRNEALVNCLEFERDLFDATTSTDSQ